MYVRHIGNSLNVQDEMGFETVFKGDDCQPVHNVAARWHTPRVHQQSIVNDIVSILTSALN